MRIIIGCECSGIVRDAFTAKGHDAWSCDLRPTERPGKHIIGDILDYLGDDWDMGIFHPDCTYLCSSGLHWNHRIAGRQELTEQALAFVRKLFDAPILRKALENPVGCIGTRIRPATQYIQPYQFGHDASKKTGLWLENLPPLKATKYIEPRMVNGKKRWNNQTDSGQNRLAPSDNRWIDRARTYEGIAQAMAEQWNF